MPDRPRDLAFSETLIAGVVELESKRRVGRCSDDVLRLMDIRQGMRVGARRSGSRRASGSSRGRVSGLTSGSEGVHRKGAQSCHALPSGSELPYPLDSRTGP